MSLPALKDLFERQRSRATGLWVLGEEPKRTIYMEAGDIVFATSTDPLDRLTHLLVERGKITQAQLDYAMANLNPAMSIGKNLIEMGFITQRDLLAVAKGQVERVVCTCLAATTESPAFEARELDARTVRLPFDTPAMLLAGVLDLRDRELMLEELGPLNQVVVLETRRLQDFTLPADLAKLPGLLDGTRTLLELSRETSVEPFRLGAFILFLREMGWARLHELPPLDRSALERALEPAETTISPALPEPESAPEPLLAEEPPTSPYSTHEIRPAPEQLPSLGPEDELEEPLLTVPEPFLSVPEPLPTVPEPLLTAPEPLLTAPEPLLTVPPEPLPLPEPALPIQHEAEVDADVSPAEAPEPEAESTPPTRRSWLLPLLLIPLVGLGLWGGLKWARRSRTAAAPAPKMGPAPAPKPAAPAPAPEAAVPVPAPAAEPKAAPEPTKVVPEPAKPAPPPVAAGPASKAQRLATIAQGNWKQAIAEGAAQRELLQSRWTLRLEIACQGATVQQAAELLNKQDPDLFIVPMVLRDGKTCYQIFLGSYGSEAAAKAAAQGLPAPFLVEGNRPKPFRVAQIPDRQ